jgi:hypothetical protein
MTLGIVSCHPFSGRWHEDMSTERARAQAVGHITVVEERRFLLITDDGRGCQLTLTHNAATEAETLHRFQAQGTHVVVVYSGEPGTASGVAHAVSPG